MIDTQNSDAPAHSGADLDVIYQTRFKNQHVYRARIWAVLITFFSKWIAPDGGILDLGCGYCEFVNQLQHGDKYGMDLNPEAQRRASADVKILEQDCSQPWPLPAGALATVFTSNFLEHLPTKAHVEQTLLHAHRALCSGGRIIAMGPNIKCVSGAYWDFFDHYVALTELSMTEILTKCGFEVEICTQRFLPYSMSQGRTYPVWMLRAYLQLPLVWRLFGQQFFLVGRKR